MENKEEKMLHLLIRRLLMIGYEDTNRRKKTDSWGEEGGRSIFFKIFFDFVNK